MKIKTCITEDGKFIYGKHTPSFTVTNLRGTKNILPLGVFPDGTTNFNERNFPDHDVVVEEANLIYEIPNPFPFRGTTYIAKSWAEAKAKDPSKIKLETPSPMSFSSYLKKLSDKEIISHAAMATAFEALPEPVLLTISTCSTDPEDLIQIAHVCCEFQMDEKTNRPVGLKYKKDDNGRIRSVIKNHPVFEALANNIHLPEEYKEVMVLRPGAQGGSEIVGEIKNNDTHIFEYLRINSYIPWGHYAANMANDAVRYHIRDLTSQDMTGLRHLYYQRTFVRLAKELGLDVPMPKKTLTEEEIETLRRSVQKKLSEPSKNGKLTFNAPLWGWNYGFDFAASNYRLHASHQQIHQQFAMLPAMVNADTSDGNESSPDTQIPAYGCGDLIADFIADYKEKTGHHFFEDYIKAIQTNTRMDGKPEKEKSLIVYEDANIMVFVPKAQTSQWELQLMPLAPIGNILEADSDVRKSIDRGLLVAMKILTALGAKMVTLFEFPKRFDAGENKQHLIYVLLPRLPESPGAFSEAQLRWINGHYPEDFAICCRQKFSEIKGTF